MNRAIPRLSFLPGALLLALLVPGCFMSRSTINEPMKRAVLESLVPGQSTAKDVVAALGAPSEVVQLGNRSAYRYEFAATKTAGFSIIVVTFVNDETCSDRIWFFFDAKDVLTHMGATFQAKDPRFDMPWQDLPGE